MTVYSQPITDIAGAGDQSRFWFYREDNLSPSADESAIITGGWVDVQPVDGVLTTPSLTPGPAKVSWGGQAYDLIIPDHPDDDPIPLWPDIQNYIPQPGPVVSAAVAAKEAAVAARDAAQEILADVESGVVPDAGVAARVATSGSATRTAVEARVRAVGDATYERVAMVTADPTLANGSADNRAYLQGLIDTAAAWGASIRIPAGKNNAAWRLSGHLDLWSGQTLDATDARIELAPNSHDFMLGNKARVAIATVSGVSVTSGSAAITSSAAFQSGHAGKQIAVLGAGWNGSPLYGTYAHTDASNGTVKPVVAATPGTTDVKALTTVSGATAQIFNRDHDITVIGGRWVRLVNTSGTANDYKLHLMMFRRVDRIKVIDSSFEAYGTAKYCINLGDVTDYQVVRPFFNGTISDGVHVNGPARGGSIQVVRGKTEDDIVSFTAADYWETGLNALFNDVSGDIADCEVLDMSPSGAKSGLKILGGGQYKIRGVTARGITGWVTRRPVYIADDLTGASDVSVTIDGLHCIPGDGYNSVFINATNAKDVVVRNFEPIVSATQTAVPIQLATNAVVDFLSIDGVNVRDLATSSLSFLQVNTGCTINELQASGVRFAYPSASTGTPYALLGTVKRIKFCGAHHYKNAKAVVKHDSGAAALSIDFSPNVSLENCEYGVWTNSTNALDVVFAGGLMDVFGGYIRTQTTGALSVRGAAPRGLRVVTLGIRRDSTAAVRVISDAMPVDLAVLAKNMGDRAYNTNAALGCGVGPAISDGSQWKNIYTAAVTS